MSASANPSGEAGSTPGSHGLVPEPSISVCMPNFNHAAYLEGALEAIITQSMQPLEVLVFDDGSTDNSVHILRRYARAHQHIRIVEEPVNRGVVNALKQLTELARGDYVLFTAADDKLLPTLIEHSTTMLRAHPDAGLCLGLSRVIDHEGRDLGVYPSPFVSREPVFLPPEQIRNMLEVGTEWFVGANAVVLRRIAVIDVGWRDELQSFNDGFVCRVIALRYGVCFIPEPLAAWRQLDDSYSRTIARDPEVTIAIARHTKRLMTSEFSNLFPPGHAEKLAVDLEVAARLEALRFKRRDWIGAAPPGARWGRVRRDACLLAAHLELLVAEERVLRRHHRPWWPPVLRRLKRLTAQGALRRASHTVGRRPHTPSP